MNSTLIVEDPLAEQEVTIIITLAASERLRAERPLLVSVGVAEQLPVIKTGTFGDLNPLIEEAWTAFGVRTQVAAATPDGETLAEEQIVATEIVASAQTDDNETIQLSTPTAPQPQAKNLSLF